MPPTKQDTGHGALFDSFPDRPSSLHGGAKFDEGFNLQEKPKGQHGRNWDEWGKPGRDVASHGQIWDEFGWKDMPESHGGILFDEGFDSPSANETSRGQLFDLFEPSTQVKFIYDGQDSEGIVDHVREDGVAMVTPRAGGKPVEVGLEQFLAYKSPSMDNAGTVAERSQAEAPSAWSPDARGGTHNTAPVPSDAGIPSGAPDPGRPVEPTPQGMATDARSEIPVDWSTVDQLKTILAGDDVAKAAADGGFRFIHPGYAQHFSGGRTVGHSRDVGDGVIAHHQVGRGEAGTQLNHIGQFPTHGAAHTAIMAHESKLQKATATKDATPMLDVLKRELGGVEKEAVGERAYRMTHAEEPHAAHHWDGRGRHIGTSVEHIPGKVVAAHHPEKGEPHMLPEQFRSHEHAHRRIVEHDCGTAKAGVVPLDVLKEHVGWNGMVKKLEDEGHPKEHAEAIAGYIARKKYGAGMNRGHAGKTERQRLPSDVLKSGSRFDLAKEVTVAETAIQAESGASTLAGAEGAGTCWCPECRKSTRLSDDGRCPDCNMALAAHGDKRSRREKGDGNGQAESSAAKTRASIDDLRKAFGAGGDTRAGGNAGPTNMGTTWDGSPHSTGQQTGQATSDPEDVEIEERPHPDSDHHGNLNGVPTTCPHCGEVIAQLDEKTAQGAPSRTGPTVDSGSPYDPTLGSHKCLEGFMDTLKAASTEEIEALIPAGRPLDALKDLVAA